MEQENKTAIKYAITDEMKQHRAEVIDKLIEYTEQLAQKNGFITE